MKTCISKFKIDISEDLQSVSSDKIDLKFSGFKDNERLLPK
jgi:hypothetical protein